MPLALRIGVGIEEEDRDGLDGAGAQCGGESLEFSLGDGGDDLAQMVGPLPDLEAQFARDERLVALVSEIERVGPVGARDFQHVAKAARRHQRGARAPAL